MSVGGNRLGGWLAAVVLLVGTSPAAAQDRQNPDDERPPYSRWSWGVMSGPQEVSRRGITVGTEIGVRLRKGLHVVVESGWMSDVVTRSRIDELDGYLGFIREAYDVDAGGRLDGPTWFGLAGLKVMPDGGRPGESRGIRPYVQATIGAARVEYKPDLTVDGEDVSGAGLVLYGVTLGRDLLGTKYRFAYGGGAGVVFGDSWYLDLGARILRIHTTDHPTVVKRLVVGFGRRF